MKTKNQSKREWSLSSTITKFTDKTISVDSIRHIEVITTNRSQQSQMIRAIWSTSSIRLSRKVCGTMTITKTFRCSLLLKDQYMSWKRFPKRQTTKKFILPWSTFLFLFSCWIMEIAKKKAYYACKTCKKPTEKK